MRIALALALSGCSFIAGATGVYRPDHEVPAGSLPCDTHAPQFLDGVTGVTFLALAGLIAISGASHSLGSDIDPALGLLLATPAAVVGGVYTGSAFYGKHANARCEHELAVERAQHPIEITPVAHDPACVQRRREILTRVQQASSASERGELLKTLPDCE